MQDSSSVLHQGQAESGSVAENAADTLARAAQQVETEQSGHGAAEQPQTDATPSVNWDSDENPYRARLRGIQGRLQEEVEKKRAYEHRLQEVERQQVMQQAQQMHPQDAQAYVQNWQQQAAFRQREQELSQQQQTMEQAARVYWVNQTAQKYGVPAQQLARFNDPDSMEYHARAIADERRKRTQANRQSRGNDRFEGESPGRPRPEKRPTTYDEARGEFVRRAEQLRAQQ